MTIRRYIRQGWARRVYAKLMCPINEWTSLRQLFMCFIFWGREKALAGWGRLHVTL